MSLFFKHLLQSIKRKPLQPLIITITLIISIIMTTCALSLKTLLTEETKLSAWAQYGSADVMVSLNGGSSSRFIFKKDAEALLGSDCTVIGTYEIVLSFTEISSFTFAVATELACLNSVFEINFSEYGRITEDTLDNAILITRSFANKHGLKVGDTVTASLLSQKITYTVQGISEIPYLGSYDVLVDIQSVVNVLMSKSLVAAALGDDFKPSSSLYIDLNETDMTADQCIERLKADPSFTEKSFTDLLKVSEGMSNVLNLNNAIDISVVLVCALAMAITFCCNYILAGERHEENLSFSYAGANLFRLRTLQYAEVMLYWIFGVFCAAFASTWLIIPICNYAGLKYVVPRISVNAMLLASAVILISLFATVTLFIVASSKKKRPSVLRGAPVIAICILIVALMVAVFTVPIQLKLSACIILVVLSLLLFFIITPLWVKLFSQFLSAKVFNRISSGRFKIIRFSAKNLFSVSPLHNVTRLISALISIIIVAFIIVTGTHSYIITSKRILSYDHVILGTTERCEKKILECDKVLSVEKVYFSALMVNGNAATLLISSDNVDAINTELNITEAPIGNEAFITKSVSEATGLKLGDSFNVDIDGNSVSLTVKEITPAPLPYICFDCESLGISPNILMPIFKEGVSETEGIDAITELISDEVAVISTTEALMSEKTKTLKIFLSCGDILWVVVLLFSAVGLFDCTYNNHMARKEEFKLFRVAGMSKREVSRLTAYERIISLMIGCLSGVLCALMILPFINKAMLSLGTDLLELFFAVW